MLSARVLNRTLLQRQHLLERTSAPPLDEVRHLLGLQAQETLAPYVSLWSRLHDFDPATVSDALAERTAVRLLLMRGTVHLVTAQDAVLLRPLVQPVLDRQLRTGPPRGAAADLDTAKLAAATVAELEPGPVPLRELGELLSTTFPDVPADALATAARLAVPLVQVPPRGQWNASGGVVHQSLQTWCSEAGTRESDEGDLAEVVRRYLRALGPATAADVSTWSGLTGVTGVLDALSDELRTDRDEDGRTLHDLADLPLADADQPAPVRLLGRYDNVWLSHRARDRVTGPEPRSRWTGSNGGVAATVFVDGWLQGLWRRKPSGAVDVELFRDLTATERDELDVEVAALEAFLAR